MATAFKMTRQVFMRQIPDDFVEVYLQIGWDGIEDHYRAHKLTIKRWVQECGGDELKKRRRDAVKAKRYHATRQHVQRGGVVKLDRRPPPEEVVSAAAHFLRHPNGGGWRVFPSQQGDWFVGINRRSASEVVAMAVRNGFDPSAVIVGLGEG
jgi:hypothetical protein